MKMKMQMNVNLSTWFDYLEGVAVVVLLSNHKTYWTSWVFWVVVLGLKLASELLRRIVK